MVSRFERRRVKWKYQILTAIIKFIKILLLATRFGFNEKPSSGN